MAPGLVNESIENFDAHLLPNNPAIDIGDNGVCPAADYAGTTRPVDGDGDQNAVCDLGAFEWLVLEANTDWLVSALDEILAKNCLIGRDTRRNDPAGGARERPLLS